MLDASKQEQLRLDHVRAMLRLSNLSNKPPGIELLGETAMYLKHRNGLMSNHEEHFSGSA